MADPKWFDEEYYLTGKVAQLKSLDKQYKDWLVDDVKKAFSDAGLTAYEHFAQFGHSEWISPSADFDANYYIASKAAQLNEMAYGGRSNWTMQDVVDSFKAAGLSAWDHYAQYGFAEGVNPSESFDTDAYCAAKAVELNKQAYDGKTDWTVADVKAAFSAAGITALQHAAEFAETENINVPAATDKDAVQDVMDKGSAVLPGDIPTLSLEDAVAAAVAGNLPDVYKLDESALNAGELSVADAGHIKDIVKGADNYKADAPFSYSYTLADTLANLQNASASVFNSAKEKLIVDTYETVKAADDLGGVAKAELTGDATNGYLSTEGIKGLTIAQLGGGNGADYLGTNTASSVLFGGSITEKDENGLYAESQDSITSNALNEKFDKVFVNSNGEGKQWISDTTLSLFQGANIFDIHGNASGTTAVASTAKDVFLLQSGDGVNGKTAETNVAKLEIQHFKVGQDALMILNQGQSTDKIAESSADILDQLTEANGITMKFVNGQSVTITIDWSTLDGKWDGLNITQATTEITLQGVQGLENVDNVADFFSIA